jgi:hypothetical protein
MVLLTTIFRPGLVVYCWCLTFADVRKEQIESNMKGSGCGGQQQQPQQALGEEGGFAVHASVYGKVQAGPNVNPND